MSDRLAAKIKDNAPKPKYSSLNLNQTYKGNKVEIKTSSGATRHGLQSLGKIGSSRRIPPPANLPSLKSENSGNDPTVSLVPSGGGGWGSAKEKNDNPKSSSTPPPSSFQTPQPSTAVAQQPLLQPQRPTAPSFPSAQAPPSQQAQATTRQEKTATTSAKPEKNEGQAKTWGSVSQSEAGGQGKTYSHQPTPYFNREFPTLGQDNGEVRPDVREDHGPAPIIRNTHEPPWMERTGPGPPPNYPRHNDSYNGVQPFYRRPNDYQNNRNNTPQYQPQHYGNNYHPGQPNRTQHGFAGQDAHDRPPYQRSTQGSKPIPRPDRRQEQDRENKKSVVRPAVLRPEDIQAMDDEDDDGGWAGAHGEVDYTAKLNFEDFDEEDKEAWHKENSERPRKEHNKENEPQESEQVEPVVLRRQPQVNDRSKQPKSAWGELPQRPQESHSDKNRQMRSFDNQRPDNRAPWNVEHPPTNQTRVSPGQYPPLSGPREASPSRQPNQECPPSRREAAPTDEWTQKRQKQQEEMQAAVERARKRKEKDEMEFQAKTKGAAMMKLKAMEEKSKPSDLKADKKEEGSATTQTSDKMEHEKADLDVVVEHKTIMARPDDLPRRRTDSDSSDASRSSGSRQFYQQQRNIPPRFQQQRQQQQQQYQQQQLYQASQQTANYPHREVHEPRQTIDSGPISPSGKTNKPGDGLPVKRIMKRSDSSSTAGDDVASVKSLESVGDKERFSASSSGKEQDTTKADSKRKDSQTFGTESAKKDSQRKPNNKAMSDQKSEKSVTNKEDSSQSTGSARKREYKANDKRSEEPHKRKRDDQDDLDWDDRRTKLSSRDRTSDSRGRTRPLSSARGRGRGVGRGRQDYRSAGLEGRQRHLRDSRSKDSRDTRELKKEFTDKPDRQREQKIQDDHKSDFTTSTDDKKEVADLKKENRPDRETSSDKSDVQDQRESQEKGERKTDKFDKKSGRYDRNDDRATRPKKYDTRKESRDGKEEPQKDISKDRADPKQDNKTAKDESRKESRDNKEDKKITYKFASRDIREEEGYKSQRVNRDNNRYQDHRQDRYQRSNRESDRYHDQRSNRDGHRYQDQRTNRDGDRYQNRGEKYRDHRDRQGERDGDQSEAQKLNHAEQKNRESDKHVEQSNQEPAKYQEHQASREDTKLTEDSQINKEFPAKDSKDSQEVKEEAAQIKERLDKDDRYREKDSRTKRDYPTRRDRGGHRGHFSTRGSRGGLGRGLRRGSGRIVGSGRIPSSNYSRPTKRDEYSDDNESDDSGSEASSYTTATSASEERPDDKDEKPKEQTRTSSQSSTSTRVFKSTRGNRGRGNSYMRTRPQPEKPPRFQKQQEKAAQQRNSSRGGLRGERNSARGTRGRGRGRVRGNVMAGSQDDNLKSDTVVESTENWDDDIEASSKEPMKDEKSSRPRGGFGRPPDKNTNHQRGSREEAGKFPSRRDGQTNSQQRKGDSFLADKQVKVEGSKSASGEPRGFLPAAKNTDLTTSKKSSGTPKDDKKSDYGSVDVIDGKVPKRNEAIKKANIELFDLHNVAGVICIDDIPDDASDISSSGFVEVTSKRTQKEQKEKLREEDERRKRNEEKANQRNADSKFKKNQTNKPPRFSKQHQNSKSFDGKLPVSVSLEGTPGLVSSSYGSSPSSTNSTKRNSPITVERPLSPQGPVFNAWNKPLTLVTPAKPPGASMVISNVPDPLAVGSGKPPRQPQPTVIPIQNSLMQDIEDKSAEDELKEITKEIESMAPTEEEVNSVTSKLSESTSSASRDKRHDHVKKTQSKQQRERPPRFERTVKRKNTNDEPLKKDLANEDDKIDKNLLSMENDASEAFKSQSGNDNTAKVNDQEKTKEEHSKTLKANVKNKDSSSQEGTESDSSVPRKDSDISADSEGNGDSSMFTGRPLSVEISDSSEAQERPPTPVSPAYVEMSKRMFAARKAWEDAPSSAVSLSSVTMDSPSTWSESNSSSVARTVVNSGSKEAGSLVESVTEQVNEAREMNDDSIAKSDVSKASDSQFIPKKTGGNEHQNVCKVKPQQQQSVKPQHVLLAASSTEERRTSDLEAIAPSQTVIAQDHLLPQNVSSSYSFQLEPHLLQLQHRQPQHFMQPLQSLQQSTQVPANRYQIQAQMQQVTHQPTSAPSPLSQSPQELFQSQYLPNNLYSASGFPGSQSFVSIPLVATTTTPSYATSTSRTQSMQGQQPKTVTSSMFGQPGSQAQAVYMPFDPQNLAATPTLLNFNQQSQAQRPIIGNHGVGFTDVFPQQQHLTQSNQHPAQQQFQRPFGFQTKPPFDNEHNPGMKTLDQMQSNPNHQQSDMVKHINAKPFEPPKRLSTPTSSTTAVGLMSSAVNPNVVHIRPNAPTMGALSHSPPMQTSYLSNRPVSMSPVDPNVPFAPGTNSFTKHAPIGHFQVSQQQRPPVQQLTPFQQQPVHIKPQQLQQHQPLHMQQTQPNQQQHNHMASSGGIPQQALLPRYGAVGTVRPSQHPGNQHFPGPIQRPPSSGVMQSIPQNILQHQQNASQQPRPMRQQVSRMPHNMPPKQPLMLNRPPMPQQMQGGAQQIQFKTMQHQKMLEETRLFFATQEQPAKMKSQQQQNPETEKPSPQQQVPKHGQPFQQNMKQIHSQPKPGQEPKMPQQHTRQSVQQKQVPLAPSSGVHHQHKPPRMSQDKSKQLNQDKKEKKEDSKSHIIELPRKKPQDGNNKSKQNSKTDPSKNEDTTNQTSKTDGKQSSNQRRGPIRIAPMIQKPSQGGGRGNRPNKPRAPLKNTSNSAQSKTKSENTTRTATGNSAPANAPSSKNASQDSAAKGGVVKEPTTKESEEKKPDPMSVTS